MLNYFWRRIIAVLSIAIFALSAQGFAATIQSAHPKPRGKKIPVITKISFDEGVLVEWEDGRILQDIGGSRLYNPASTTKLGVALWALTILGPEYVFPSDDAKKIGALTSAKLIDTLHWMLCRSDNTLADNIAAFLGGPKMLENFLSVRLNIPAQEIVIEAASGLSHKNRISTRGMMKILRALNNELSDRGYTLEAALPLAGVSKGTLEHRFTDPRIRGTVEGKTGTLAGTSALVGRINTANGVIWFVSFQQQVDPETGTTATAAATHEIACSSTWWTLVDACFHKRQEEIVVAIQKDNGCGVPFGSPHTTSVLPLQHPAVIMLPTVSP